MRGWLLSLFRRISRPFWGKGIYWKFPFISKVYNSVFRCLSSEGIILININGLKIYAEGKSAIAKFLGVKGSYEEETTKLFAEVLKEGMTVLDIGANIGYFSLIAGRLVRDKGKVFAFEPYHWTFSLLQKNIEANGFNNVMPVEKAASNHCGKQKLFLANDPLTHSLGGESGNNFVEVDVTTVDEFLKGQNISVDLVKMDVEGAEMNVLEGMSETISKNPHMKIITEFDTNHLEQNNCSPSVFLERLIGYGFKLYAVDDDTHTRLLITPDNVNELLKPRHIRRLSFSYIFCDRDA
jgi:FkbM family methyltransferase